MAFLVNEAFTTGSTPSGWFANADCGYATSPAPLEGSYSVGIDPDEIAVYLGSSEISVETWGQFLLNMPTLPSVASTVFVGQDNGFGTVFTIVVLASGQLRITDNGVGYNVGTVGTIAAATTYHVWVRHKSSTGSNDGQGQVWFNVADDRDGTVANDQVSAATGTITSGIKYLTFQAPSGAGGPFTIVDLVQWADTDEFVVGGNPWYYFAQQ